MAETANVPSLPKVLLPLALLLGACDTDEPAEAADDEEIAAPSHSDREARHAGKFAKLDVDGDGALSKAELGEHKLAALFDEIDGDADGKLTKDEFFAAKKAHHRGKGDRHGNGERHGKGDPAERAAKLMGELDADQDGALTKTETEAHRWLGEKFATVDADADGKITIAELTAFKATHHGKRHGKHRGEKAPGEAAQAHG
jgi:Ca2+-binding EF-hand superfamily protein